MPVLVDLIKLRDVVRNSVAKKTDSEKLVAKVNKVNTSAFVLKTKYDTDQSESKNIVLKRQITILKFLRKKVKFLILVI